MRGRQLGQLNIETLKILSEEATNYRAHLEKQFNQLKWSIGVIVVSSLAVFVYLFGKTSSELDQYVKAQVSERVVDYKVELEVQEKLTAIIDLEVKSIETQEKVGRLVEDLLEKSFAVNAEKQIDDAVESTVTKIKALQASQLLDSLPVGSIIPSVAPPDVFGVRLQSNSPSVSKWAIADGRPVPGSKYEKTVASSVPDLRGLFLRGMNLLRSDGREDPDGNRSVGSFQNDSIVSHAHAILVQSNQRGLDSGILFDHERYVKSVGQHTSAFGGVETRPKNAAVFYYVKIN